MGSELKDLYSKPAKIQLSDSTHDVASAKDDRPLLKPDSTSAAEFNIQELLKKFAAYVRNDVYGAMGRGQLPLKERFLLGITLVTLLRLRIIIGMTLLVGIHLSEERERPGAIVSNHVSFLDIISHVLFLSELRCQVGFISKCLGCVYIQRESKSSGFKGVAGVVTDRVHEARQNRSAPMMMLFPEGTTTNWDFLLPFKTGAFLAGAPVVPVIVRHVVLLLCQFVNHMEVIHVPIYYPSLQEKDDPKQYANNVPKIDGL
ncbi:Lysophospholipid acyltransferase LPEAT1 [Hibiscus syriacus]|uniref:Lysophospholipid acyltransferase LPEAT1 n=1 Tax=Hibiscus syriacus TaxID=106335 RepID=A0A6A3BEC3_HIBSY|nr:Lysophospholipid acyltransferase LPEAT1 [Hibiscus syriacus]